MFSDMKLSLTEVKKASNHRTFLDFYGIIIRMHELFPHNGHLYLDPVTVKISPEGHERIAERTQHLLESYADRDVEDPEILEDTATKHTELTGFETDDKQKNFISKDSLVAFSNINPYKATPEEIYFSSTADQISLPKLKLGPIDTRTNNIAITFGGSYRRQNQSPDFPESLYYGQNWGFIYNPKDRNNINCCWTAWYDGLANRLDATVRAHEADILVISKLCDMMLKDLEIKI
jgi:hypothetical protein